MKQNCKYSWGREDLLLLGLLQYFMHSTTVLLMVYVFGVLVGILFKIQGSACSSSEKKRINIRHTKWIAFQRSAAQHLHKQKMSAQSKRKHWNFNRILKSYARNKMVDALKRFLCGKSQMKYTTENRQRQRCSALSLCAANGCQIIMRDQMQTSLFPCSSNQSAIALLFTHSAQSLLFSFFFFAFVWNIFDIQFSTWAKRRFIAFHRNFMMKWFLHFDSIVRERHRERESAMEMEIFVWQ